jgi:YD repeat-containing protein
VSLDYTDDGLRSTMTDDTGTSSWSYDALDRLTASENGQGQTVGYHYDLANRLTSIDYPDALGPGPPSETPDTVDTGTVTRGYDDDDRLTANASMAAPWIEFRKRLSTTMRGLRPWRRLTPRRPSVVGAAWKYMQPAT